MMRTYGDLFTGFGGATLGALAAGCTPLWGVEYRPDVAEVANANLGGHVRVLNLLDADPHAFERVDHLHASPPCPNFSVAKAGAVETPLDIALARKVAEFVTALLPETFTLENVYAYRHSKSWRVIEDALHRAGYWVSVEHVNAADFGVPQTRKRMIVRAVRGGFVPYLPEPVAWVGWYAAIEDLLDTLPASQFAPWQLARLPESIAGSLFVVAQQSDDGKGTEYGYGNPTREASEPALTITKQSPGWFKAFLSPVQGEASGVFPPDAPAQTIGTSHGAEKYRAFLVDGKLSASGANLQIVEPCAPARTVVSSLSVMKDARAWLVTSSGNLPNGHEDRGPVQVPDDTPCPPVTRSFVGRTRAWLSAGRVVAMTPRALARFQSFPDSYELPEKRTLAAYGIGNAVPPLLMQRILEGLVWN
jgi:site-specific DNA-cytosine methylase